MKQFNIFKDKTRMVMRQEQHSKPILIKISLFVLLLTPGFLANGNDSTNVEKKHKFDLVVRNYFMSTVNPGNSADYYVNTTALRAGFTASLFDNIKFESRVILSGRTLSNDLSELDQQAGRSSRFERHLTGFIDPMGNRYFGTIDKLNLSYKAKNWELKLGRMAYTSPAVNEMDGRIKPSEFQGVDLIITPSQSLTFRGSFFNQFTTWGVQNWKSTSDIIGHFGNGVDFDGNKQSYRGMVNTSGLGIFHSKYQNEGLNIQFWNYWLDKVNNTSLLRGEYKLKNVGIGISGLVQRPLAENENNFYYDLGEKTNSISFLSSYRLKQLEFKVAHTIIQDQGRFIFPREFGTEPFYTFLPRMRIEGYGGASIWLGSAKFSSENFSIFLAYALNNMPDRDNYQLSKLGLQDYNQLMIDLKYSIVKKHRTDFRLLYISTDTGGEFVEPARTLNNYFFHHWNLVVNHYF